jgi:hypothetical protein
MLKALVSGLVALGLAACASSTNLLSEAEVKGMRIERIDVSYRPDAIIWWGKAEREFVERELSKKSGTPGKAKRPPSVTDASNTGEDAISAEYNRIADSPEAKAHLRETLARLVKERLQKEVVPEFKGTRPAVLEVVVVGFHIPSAAQRVVLGGAPTFGALRILKDAKTGKELAKLDQNAAGFAGNGLLGVAIDQALPDLEDRVIAAWIAQTKTWLVQPQKS